MHYLLPNYPNQVVDIIAHILAGMTAMMIQLHYSVTAGQGSRWLGLKYLPGKSIAADLSNIQIHNKIKL